MSALLAQVDRLHARHECFAAMYYRRLGGAPTGEAANYVTMRRRFREYCVAAVAEAERAGMPVPVAISKGLVAGWRDAMAQEGLARPYVNQELRRFRTMLRWAASLELVTDDLVNSIRLVQPLKPHRSAAREPGPKRPPSAPVMAAVMADLPADFARVAKTLSLTAMRPGEVLSLRTSEITLFEDGSGQVTKASHKTAHRGKARIIPLSPEAAQLLSPLLKPLVPDAFIFAGSGRSKRGHLTVDALRKAMARACRRIGAPLCRPYDIRRRTARTVRSQVSLDAAQALLGHNDSKTTEIYAPLDLSETQPLQLAQQAVGALARSSGIDEPMSRTASPTPAKIRPQALGGVG